MRRRPKLETLRQFRRMLAAVPDRNLSLYRDIHIMILNQRHEPRRRAAIKRRIALIEKRRQKR